MTQAVKGLDAHSTISQFGSPSPAWGSALTAWAMLRILFSSSLCPRPLTNLLKCFKITQLASGKTGIFKNQIGAKVQIPKQLCLTAFFGSTYNHGTLLLKNLRWLPCATVGIQSPNLAFKALNGSALTSLTGKSYFSGSQADLGCG